MMRYVFNSELLKHIHEVLGLKVAEVANAIEVKKCTFCNRKNLRRDFPLCDLIRLCNKFRLPISYFFMECGIEDVRQLDAKSPWDDIEFSHLEFGDRLSSGKTMQECFDSADVSLCYFYSNLRSEDTGIWAGKYLEICNMNNIYPGDYVIDNNLQIPVLEGFHPMPLSLKQRLDIANKRIRELQRANFQLQTRNRKLRERLQDQDIEDDAHNDSHQP